MDEEEALRRLTALEERVGRLEAMPSPPRGQHSASAARLQLSIPGAIAIAIGFVALLMAILYPYWLPR